MRKPGPIVGRRAYLAAPSRSRLAAQSVASGVETIPEVVLRTGLTRRTVLRAVEQLRDEPTRVLTRDLVEQLVFGEQLSMWQAAAKLGLTRDAVRYHVRRLRKERRIEASLSSSSS